jgi:glucose-1-phosphate cytidylyltransferase
VHPPSRFAVLKIDSNNKVVRFREKPKSEVGWVNGGFFILQNKVIELIADDNTIWERTPLEQLTEDGELVAFRHTGFWQALDTIHDKRLLEQAYIQRIGPWLDN